MNKIQVPQIDSIINNEFEHDVVNNKDIAHKINGKEFFWMRMWAFWVDSFIITTVLFFGLSLITGPMYENIMSGNDSGIIFSYGYVILNFIQIFLLSLYYFHFQPKSTFGQMIFGIQYFENNWSKNIFKALVVCSMSTFLGIVFLLLPLSIYISYGLFKKLGMPYEKSLMISYYKKFSNYLNFNNTDLLVILDKELNKEENQKKNKENILEDILSKNLKNNFYINHFNGYFYDFYNIFNLNTQSKLDNKIVKSIKLTENVSQLFPYVKINRERVVVKNFIEKENQKKSFCAVKILNRWVFSIINTIHTFIILLILGMILFFLSVDQKSVESDVTYGNEYYQEDVYYPHDNNESFEDFSETLEQSQLQDKKTELEVTENSINNKDYNNQYSIEKNTEKNDNSDIVIFSGQEQSPDVQVNNKNMAANNIMDRFKGLVIYKENLFSVTALTMIFSFMLYILSIVFLCRKPLSFYNILWSQIIIILPFTYFIWIVSFFMVKLMN